MNDGAFGRVWTSSAVRRFAVQAGIVLVVFTTAAFFGIYAHTEQLVLDSVALEADSYLDLVITTREWNAGHGGVWIATGPNSRTNEYLGRLGVEPDTSTASGVPLTLRNPSAMTRELADLVAANGEVSFRLTSLEPVNPNSAPDAWEARQLEAFERGRSSAETIEDGDGTRVYRKMRPLLTDRACLLCHAVQGYQEGDVRGALSVRIDLERRDAELRSSALGLGALWSIAVSALGFIMFGLVYRMAARLERGEAKLKVLATTDELTGLPNRRTTLERLTGELSRGGRGSSRTGAIAVDIDHFKSVNDSYGHAAGDVVLASVAKTMQGSLRPYDIVGRFGGEEFLVVAPEIDASGLAALAERIRREVEAEPVILPTGDKVTITISAGCTLADAEDTSPEVVLNRADRAMYLAKDNGRNRVEVG